ncbi:MAG: hypothetical protein E4H10_03565 [Bacteroidia bacterium]|nr:MAG: hypothetical protein E4H10_03565 [Bacteroidia bacterium]
MRKRIPYTIMSLVAAFIFSAGLAAQEKTEVSIQVKKDGKVVKDTTYQFEDADEAKHVVKMVEVMSGMDADMEKAHYNYTMSHSGGKHANTMVFISEGGDLTEIKEMHGDSLVWISEGDEAHMEHMHGENMIVMKKGDGETFDIWVDKDGEEGGKRKQVKVVVSGDEKGNWTAVSSGEADLDESENVFYVSEDDDVKVEVREILEKTEDGENVKVIVIKKEIHEDVDQDVDKDHDEDVDVEVVKKKQ